MAPVKRVKIGGRAKGTPNRKTADLQAILDREKCDPRVVMAQIVNNTLACGVCRGTGKTLYKKPPVPKFRCENCGHEDLTAKFINCPKCTAEPAIVLAERVCLSCYGTLMEHCNPALRGTIASEFMQYLLPKRKAIEVSGVEGGAVEHTHTIRFVG